MNCFLRDTERSPVQQVPRLGAFRTKLEQNILFEVRKQIIGFHTIDECLCVKVGIFRLEDLGRAAGGACDGQRGARGLRGHLVGIEVCRDQFEGWYGFQSCRFSQERMELSATQARERNYRL